jgi:leucyl aminopeptidase (aminopeptidase T)
MSDSVQCNLKVKYTHSDTEVIEGADLLLKKCGRLCTGEAVVIVCDPSTRAIGELLKSRARLITPRVTLVESPELGMHGQEPPAMVADEMARGHLCLGITSKSMAHTQARLKAASKGTRYLSLPDYTMELLADSSLRADYEGRGVLARRVADAFSAGTLVKVTSPGGTDITLRADGRVGNCCPGYVDGPGQLGSPPDIEANVSPIETSAEGVVVVDGSVPYPGIGLLKEPVRLIVRDGRIQQIDGGDVAVVSVLRDLFESAGSPKAYVLAECGVGLNDKATLTGVMLTDEGAAGTMHFGFGSNSTVGGLNDVAFHLDCVFLKPSLEVDGLPVLSGGEYCLLS